jgi:hypothetical protein
VKLGQPVGNKQAVAAVKTNGNGRAENLRAAERFAAPLSLPITSSPTAQLPAAPPPNYQQPHRRQQPPGPQTRRHPHQAFMTGVVAAADWVITLPTAGAAVAADEARPMPKTRPPECGFHDLTLLFRFFLG